MRSVFLLFDRLAVPLVEDGGFASLASRHFNRRIKPVLSGHGPGLCSPTGVGPRMPPLSPLVCPPFFPPFTLPRAVPRR